MVWAGMGFDAFVLFFSRTIQGFQVTMFVAPWRSIPDSVRFFQSPMTFPVFLGSLPLIPQTPLDSGCRKAK